MLEHEKASLKIRKKLVQYKIIVHVKTLSAVF